MDSAQHHLHRREFAVAVVKQLREAGYEALWAGGCVRDQLLGLHPKDYDVATNARPEEVRGIFGRKRTLAIGVSFGVISVVGNRHEGHIEIATFRQDEGYSDGRRPDAVRFSSAEEDAKRRDFTINGIFYDPLEEKVIDYVGGQEDLRNKLIRAIGNADDRIAEDKLRMLRGIRFAATYDFDLDPATFQAIKNHADWISAVSRERTAAEIQRMFEHPRKALAARYLIDSGLAKVVFQSTLFDLGKADESARLISELGSNRFESTMAAFLLPMYDGDLNDKSQEKQVKQALHDWKYSNEHSQTITWMLKSYPVLASASPETWPQVQRILVHGWGKELLLVCDAYSRCENNRYRAALEYCRQQLELPKEMLDPEPLVDGNDLIQCGFRPGPRFKDTLEEIRDLQLQGELHSKDEALAHAKNRLA